MPGEPEDRTPPEPPEDRRARRRGPRRATGGTFTGAEPRLSGLGGPAPGTEGQDGSAERAHEEWLRAQRPPHWG